MSLWFMFKRKGASGFSAASTAEEVTEGIDGTGLTAVVTANFLLSSLISLTERVFEFLPPTASLSARVICPQMRRNRW